MKNKLALALLFAGLVLAAFRPGAAQACTPPPGGLPTYTTAEHIQAAQVVLEGVVTAVSTVNYFDTATVQVIQYIKGGGPVRVDISGFGPDSLCLSEVKNGDHVIFLASGDPASGKLSAYYLSQFDATLPADAQTVADAIKASGQQPVVIGGGIPPTSSIASGNASGNAPATEAMATTFAAATLYATDPAGASLQLTRAAATMQPAGQSSPDKPLFELGPLGLFAAGLVTGLGIGLLAGVLIGRARK